MGEARVSLVAHAFEPTRRDPRFVDILAGIGYTGASTVLLGRGQSPDTANECRRDQRPVDGTSVIFAATGDSPSQRRTARAKRGSDRIPSSSGRPRFSGVPA